MEVQTDIKIFDFHLSEKDARGRKAIDDIICKLRPAWSREEIICEDIKKGLVNVMLRFSLKTDTTFDDAILMRLYGDKYGMNVFLRDNELLLMQLAHQAGAFPAVLGLFNNGLLYQYGHGRVLKPMDLHNPSIIRAVARSLAQLKCVDIRNTPLLDRSGSSTHFSSDLKVYEHLRSLADLAIEKASDPGVNARYQQVKISRIMMLEEIDHVEKMLESVSLPRAVSHNDLHIFNILYDDAKDTAFFVDYEFSYMGYEACDLAGMLEKPLRKVWAEAGIYFHDDREPEIDDSFRRTWITAYLQRKHEIQERPAPRECDIQQAMYEHQLSLSIHYLRQILLAHTFVDAEQNGLPVLGLIETAKRCYFEVKNRLSDLCQSYQRARQYTQELYPDESV